MGHGKSKESRRRNKQEESAGFEQRFENFKRLVNEENQRELKDEMEKFTREVAEEASQSLAKMEAEIAKLEEEKCRREQEKQTKEYEEEEAKLAKEKEELNKAREQLLATIDKGNAERTEMQMAHNERTTQQRKEHAEFIVTSTDDLNKYRMEKLSELKSEAEAGRAAQKIILDQQFALEHNAIVRRLALVDVVKSVNVHDDFRLRSNYLLMRFNTFKDAYYTQLPILRSISREMRLNKPLTDLPQTDIVFETFQNFIQFVDHFDIPGKFEEKYNERLKKLRHDVTEINDAMDEIDFSVSRYMEVFEKSPADNKELEENYISFKENFGLIRTRVTELVELIKAFKLPISDEMAIEINRQSKMLDTAHSNHITNEAPPLLQLEAADNNEEEYELFPVIENADSD